MLAALPSQVQVRACGETWTVLSHAMNELMASSDVRFANKLFFLNRLTSFAGGSASKILLLYGA